VKTVHGSMFLIDCQLVNRCQNGKKKWRRGIRGGREALKQRRQKFFRAGAEGRSTDERSRCCEGRHIVLT